MKYLNYRYFIFLTIFLVGSFFIYSNYFHKEKFNLNKNLEVEEEKSSNSNIIKDIKYSSKDIKGNEYIILADEGEIDLNNSEVIFLKSKSLYKLNRKMRTSLLFLILANTILQITTQSSQNVKIKYLDNRIIGDYLDFSMRKNLLIISKDVVYTNLTNVLKADVVEIDTITKNTKIFMHNNREKADRKSKLNGNY